MVHPLLPFRAFSLSGERAFLSHTLLDTENLSTLSLHTGQEMSLKNKPRIATFK